MLRRILMIIGYVGFALALVAFTIALVAYGKDYTYDFANHKIVQKGHVIIESEPSGLRVIEDGKELKKKTPYQDAYNVGLHTFGLSRDGYWPWQKVLKVVAGRVIAASYVILVPRNPKLTTLDTQPEIITQAMSKDHRKLAYITGGANPVLMLLDVPSRKTTRLYIPKIATATEPAESLKSVVWSDDNAHLLITSDMGGQPVHRLAALNGDEPINLTQVFGFNLTGLKFSSNNWRQLYWLSADGLRRIDVDAKTVSGVLADNVSQFWVQGDRVLYVQQTELGRSLWSLSGTKPQELIPALAESDTYTVASTRYNGKDYLVVVPTKTQVATLYIDIFGERPETKVITHGVTEASFAPDGHLLALSTGVNMEVYDIERSEVDQSFVIYDLPDKAATNVQVTWYNNHHFLINRDGVLAFCEFDGANSTDIAKAQAGLAAYASYDGKTILYVKPDTGSVKLTSLQLRP